MRGVLKFLVIACFMTCAGVYGTAVVACCTIPYPTIDTIDDLGFGTFAVRKNDAQYTIVIDPVSGSGTHDPVGFIEINPVQRGVYDLAGFPPNTPVILSFTDTFLTPSGPGPSFSVRDYTHNNPVSDALGNATILVGATLRTTGGGQHYDSDAYSGTFDLQIDY